MAKQAAGIKITGTIEHLSFYKMYGAYFARMKSSLTGRRFWKDKAFEGSRRSCSLLGRASRIASAFYKDYPPEKKGKGVFNEMTGRVKLWLTEGKGAEEALLLLKESYPVKKEAERKKGKERKAVVIQGKRRLFRVLPCRNLPFSQRKINTGRLYCLRE